MKEGNGGDFIQLDQYEKELVAIAKEISYYLQKSGANRADADDIAQDILVKVLEAELVLARDKLRAWLYRTAVRSYIDKYRRDKRYQDILQLEFFKPEQVTVYDRENYDFLYQAINSLKEEDALILDSYYFQDLSTKEIAKLFSISTSKVKITLFRARKQLKKLLEAEDWDAILLAELK